MEQLSFHKSGRFKDILFWLLTAIAAFEAGMIYQMKGIEKKVARLESGQRELSGNVEAQIAILRGINKGREPKLK